MMSEIVWYDDSGMAWFSSNFTKCSSLRRALPFCVEQFSGLANAPNLVGRALRAEQILMYRKMFQSGCRHIASRSHAGCFLFSRPVVVHVHIHKEKLSSMSTSSFYLSLGSIQYCLVKRSRCAIRSFWESSRILLQRAQLLCNILSSLLWNLDWKKSTPTIIQLSMHLRSTAWQSRSFHRKQGLRKLSGHIVWVPCKTDLELGLWSLYESIYIYI